MYLHVVKSILVSAALATVKFLECKEGMQVQYILLLDVYITFQHEELLSFLHLGICWDCLCST